MKKLVTLTGALLGGLLVLSLTAQDHRKPVEAPAVVVGTFDSRAVQVAWVRSKAFGEYLSAQRADIEKAVGRARAAGDLELAAELEALGPAMQERMHERGFSTAPVDDVLARIEDQFPEIARRTGVDVIVSKWVLTHRGPDAVTVDVTDALVAAFEPDAQTLATIRQLVSTDPVPRGRAGGNH